MSTRIEREKQVVCLMIELYCKHHLKLKEVNEEYASMLPDCKRAYVTKVHCTPPSDTFFPNLDADPAWKLTQILQSGEENGIRYEMCLYERK